MLIILNILILIGATFLFAMQESEVQITDFELRRRIDGGDRASEKLLFKKQIIPIFNRFLRICVYISIILTSMIWVVIFDFWWALIVDFWGIILCLSLSQLKSTKKLAKQFFRKNSHRLYAAFALLSDRDKKKIIKLSKKNPSAILYSKDELLYQIHKQPALLSEDEKIWIDIIFRLSNFTVENILLTKEKMKTVFAKDLINPLVIDDFYKSKQNIIVVVDKDSTRAVGVIPINQITVLGKHDSPYARDIMNEDFITFKNNQSALEIFNRMIKNNYNFAIIENKDGDLEGIIRLSDFMKKPKIN